MGGLLVIAGLLVIEGIGRLGIGLQCLRKRCCLHIKRLGA
jgi:hypothetical protein